MSEQPSNVQVWALTLDGRRHRVEAQGSLTRHLRWLVDDELVAETKSGSDKIRMSAADQPQLGAVAVRFSGLGRPRRATLFEHDEHSDVDALTRALAGVGGVDLEPEAGSAAAAHEDRVRAHPQRYALTAFAAGVAKVVVPIILVALLARFALSVPLPDWDLPDLPNIPWPDLPNIPWPDLPRIPWPDVTLPGWLVWTLDHAKYVWPVVLALVLARGEIMRRRKQDQLRAARASRRDEDQT